MARKKIYYRKRRTPKVTVIMAVYNAERFVRETVESILSQTLKDFEFIIVNDCSTDRTAEILKSYADRRIKIIDNKKNLGPAESRNIGLRRAKGAYIAVTDQDDISLPERLITQVKYMEKHRAIGILGTAQERMNEKGISINIEKFPIEPGLIKWSLLLGNCCVSQPTVIMRRNVIKQLTGYVNKASGAEDYELWTRALFHTKIANLPDTLVKKRLLLGGVTFSNAKTERKIVINAMYTAIERLLGEKAHKKTIEYLFWLERNILLHGFQIKRVDKKIRTHCTLLTRGISLRNFRDISSVADTIRTLYYTFMRVYRLNQSEKKHVTIHALRKLFILATVAKKISISDKKISSLFKL